MATSSTNDIKPIPSPLDLSLKVNIPDNVVSNSSLLKESPIDSCCRRKDDHSAVSSEELLSLKLLHDRLSKTMELLLPQDKSNDKERSACKDSPKDLSDAFMSADKMFKNFDYRETMKALFSLVGSEAVLNNNEAQQTKSEEAKDMSMMFQNKQSFPHLEAWSYWHDYLLSLYLMNSSLSPFVPPPIPPPPLHSATIPSSIYPPNPAFFPPTPHSYLFQNMFHSLMHNSSATSQPTDDNTLKNHLLPENVGQDLNFKGKKSHTLQFLRDPNWIYNSLALNRNYGLTKNKILDSPESYGVSLRGNQKYSIYYQQRPNNIFNNSFISPNCHASLALKSNTNSKCPSNSVGQNNEERRIVHNPEISSKKPTSQLSVFSNNSANRLPKSTSSSSNVKISQISNNVEKSSKTSLPENNSSFHNNSLTCNNNQSNNISTSIHLGKYKETVFNCSCGEEFENLYSFTIHLKTTQHAPTSSKIEKTIPKLVRGQDMWINSETEQTKEILRCMRCQQSYRTLPELTMHMVETNHYSEIVYNDTGKCVFLNHESDKVKCHSVTTGSPIPSSPGEIIRCMKRTWSSSNDSEGGSDENSTKMRKLSSPCNFSNFSDNKVDVDDERMEMKSPNKSNEDEKKIITEADSGTTDPTPDSDSQKIETTILNDFNDRIAKASDSVIKQIENFVEKSLPKHISSDLNVAQAINVGTNGANCFRGGSKQAFLKDGRGSNSKSQSHEKLNKSEMKLTNVMEISDIGGRIKEKSANETNSVFNCNSYHSIQTDLNENPLSSLQSLVETIQKSPAQIRETLQSGNNNNHNAMKSVNMSLPKDTMNYSYSSKSPSYSDSINQLQALVASTSVPSVLASCNVSSQPSDTNKGCNKLLAGSDSRDSSAAILSWYHKLGELLGLPQALSQAMLTPEAFKDLANSLLLMHNTRKVVPDSSNDQGYSIKEDDNNNKPDRPKCLSPINVVTTENRYSNKDRECDPLEQLKHLLNTTTEVQPNQSNHNTQSMPNHYNSISSGAPNSPPAMSKKAKCHFCNKPFANKGQVRLHISKGKCPSLMRSSHTGVSQVESKGNNSNLSPISLDSNYRVKDGIISDAKELNIKTESISDYSLHNSDDSSMASKSVNMIREYFKFAKQMIGNEEAKQNSKDLLTAEIE